MTRRYRRESGSFPAKDVARFWAGVGKAGPNDCWPWKRKARTRWGYGVIYMGGKYRNTHRVAFMLKGNAIPARRFVCHRCDNPPCCNPKHLFLGTHRVNQNDMARKDRSCHGTRNGRARLTEKRAMRLRLDYDTGQYSIQDVADLYGISKATAFEVIRGWTWIRVGGPIHRVRKVRP